MGEIELSEIENRIEQYPPQARHDILRLSSELRRLYDLQRHKSASHAPSPLYDPLTGLLNGGAYGVRFAMARARATRYRKIFAVMSIDVAFPEASGGAAKVGDEQRDATIKNVAERLEGCVRATDTLARIGDENFAIILEDLTQPGHAERVKQNVQDALDAPSRAGDQHGSPHATVTMEFYPRPQRPHGGIVYNS